MGVVEIGWLSHPDISESPFKDAFIVCCNAAAFTNVLITVSTTAHCNALFLKFTSLQYCNAIVGAETIQPLQLIATQLQWTTNAA